MIHNHEIKYINNEQVLYIYLDFNTEFAKINSKKTKLKLKKEIKKYINKNKIDFKGTTVAVIVGGIMIATVLLNTPKLNNKELLNNYTISLINNNTLEEPYEIVNKDIVINNNISKPIKENIETSNQNKTETTKEEKNKEKPIKENTNIIIKETSNQNKIETTKEVLKEVNNIKEPNKDISKETNEDIKDNNTYVTIYRQNGTVLTIEIEEYLIGVVAGEMPASFNIEALKAQAILSRTYTYKALNTGKKLTDTSSTQIYKSNDELLNTWGSSYNTYYNKIKQAVNSTKGIVLTYNGSLIEAVYHSTSNGKTENSIDVWNNNFPYLVSVDSPYDITNKSFEKTTFYTYEDLSNKLNTIITKDTIFNIILNESNRVKSIEFNNITYTGVEFRTKLNLRSTDFILESKEDGIEITTKGYGHGVGMSQYGANGMANNGYNYESILKHYYKGVTLTYK